MSSPAKMAIVLFCTIAVASCKPQAAEPEKIAPSEPTEPLATDVTSPPDTVEAGKCKSPQKCRDYCTRGVALACNNLGLMLQDGRGVKRDGKKALTMYRKACARGAGVGCFNAGLQLQYGSGIAADPEQAELMYSKARTTYRRACDAGELEWCVNLGVMYQDGRGSAPDPTRAARIYDKACRRGSHNGCLNLASQLMSGRGVDQDLKRGEALLQKSCDQNHLPSCNNLANHLADNASGDVERRKRAQDLYRKGCEGGIAMACRNLALMLNDAEQATPYFEKACKLFDAGGCLLVAQAFESGVGIKADKAKAAIHYHKACELGAGQGCVKLVLMGVRGEAMVTPEEAKELLERGCALRDPTACRVLKLGHGSRERGKGLGGEP